VDNATSTQLRSYNNGVVSIFKLLTENAQDFLVNDIGVLKDILLLDYEGLNTQIILLQCKWVKAHDNQQNATYT